MKSRLTLAAGLCTALAASAQAEVKVNENISLDGYIIGAGVVTEGTTAKNGPKFGKSGGAYDSAYLAVNGNYGDFSGKFSLYSTNFGDNKYSDDAGVLDAFVTYSVGALSITGGKYLGWLGYESFHSPNNAFISFSQAYYASPFSTGGKIDYAGETFSTGVSVRDTQTGPGGNFYEGDGSFSDDVGYEAYFMYTGIEKLTFFAGAGYEDIDETNMSVLTYDIWASYTVSDAISVAAEYAFLEETNNGSWLLQGTYTVSEPLSVSARLTGADGDNGESDATGYGLASTYTITENFSVKGEVTQTDYSTKADVVSYAIQGLFRF